MKTKMIVAALILLLGVIIAVRGVMRSGVGREGSVVEELGAARMAVIDETNASPATWLDDGVEFVPTTESEVDATMQRLERVLDRKISLAASAMGLSVGDGRDIKSLATTWLRILVTQDRQAFEARAEMLEQAGYHGPLLEKFRREAADWQGTSRYALAARLPVAVDEAEVVLFARDGSQNPEYVPLIPSGGRGMGFVTGEGHPLPDDPIAEGYTVIEVRAPAVLRSIMDPDDRVKAGLGVRLAKSPSGGPWIPWCTVTYTEGNQFVGQVQF